MARAFLCGCVFALLAGPVFAQTRPETAPKQDLTEKSLEELMTIDVASVTGAAKHEQRVTEAPSSVTIITAADIRTFGWRTLGEALRSVRGFYATYDRNYSYLGVRGFGRPTDYNNRVLFLIDGHRLNDNVYDAAYIGTESPIDLDLVERIEVIRGPGSSLYGSSAFFGVVNIITRRGGSIGGIEGALQAGTQDSYRARATAGWASHDERDILVSATRYQSNGVESLFYPEFDDPATNFGRAVNLDGDEHVSMFSSARLGAASFQGAFSSRTKQIPTAAWGTAFGDPRFETTDSRGWADASYEHRFGATRYAFHGFVDHMGYNGDYPDSAGIVNVDDSHGTWMGTDVTAFREFARRHHVAAGVEYRFNASQNQSNFDQLTGDLYFHDRHESHQAAIFVQDEIALSRRFTATVGVRADWWSLGPKAVKPRAGLVYRTDTDTALKVLYGEAFRAPNLYELYYTELGSAPNPDLEPETLRTTEVVFEQYLSRGLRLTVAGFYTDIEGLIDQIEDGDGNVVHLNNGSNNSTGIEFEIEHRSPRGVLSRGSIVVQRAFDEKTGERLSNAPSTLATLSLAVPVAMRQLMLAMDSRFVGSRLTLAGRSLDGVFLADGIMTWQPRSRPYSVQAGVYNILDRHFADPVGAEFVQQAIPQDGRTAAIKVGFRF